jgi:hypothetical protein
MARALVSLVRGGSDKIFSAALKLLADVESFASSTVYNRVTWHLLFAFSASLFRQWISTVETVHTSAE